MHFSVMVRDYVMWLKGYMKVNLAECMDRITVIPRCDTALPFSPEFPLKLALIGTGPAVLTEKLAVLSP